MEQLNHVHHDFHFDVHPSYFLDQPPPVMIMQYQQAHMFIPVHHYRHQAAATMPPLPKPPRVRKPLEVRDPKTYQLIDLPKRDSEAARAKRASSQLQVLKAEDFPPLPNHANTIKHEEEAIVQAFTYRDVTSKHM